tara:strand:+ start:381 stop:785 length:405 start_codon:yes stop_codon:yes gene_type:complete
MNLKIEEILMVIVAFLIGWFVRTMISGSSSGSGSRVKAVGGKHYTSSCKQYPHNRDHDQVDFLLRQCALRINNTPEGNTARNLLMRCYNIDDPDRAPTGNGCRDLRTGSEKNEEPEELISKFETTVGPQKRHQY